MGSGSLGAKFIALAICLSCDPCSFGSQVVTGVDSGISTCWGPVFPGTVEVDGAKKLSVLVQSLVLDLEENFEFENGSEQ